MQALAPSTLMDFNLRWLQESCHLWPSFIMQWHEQAPCAERQPQHSCHPWPTLDLKMHVQAPCAALSERRSGLEGEDQLPSVILQMHPQAPCAIF